MHLASRVLSSADLERMVKTSDRWMVERTGISARRIAERGTATYELATAAAADALRSAGVAPAAVDLVMVASSSPDAPLPGAGAARR